MFNIARVISSSRCANADARKCIDPARLFDHRREMLIKLFYETLHRVSGIGEHPTLCKDRAFSVYDAKFGVGSTNIYSNCKFFHVAAIKLKG